jgi:outer membrane protein TolC
MNKMIYTPLTGRGLLALACLVMIGACASAQNTRPDNKRQDVHPTPLYVAKTPPSDSAIEERLVQLALTKPEYDASGHMIRIAEYKVKAAKKSWFNLLSVSVNYNDQTFAKPAVQNGQTQYIYPKYFFGLTIPIGTIISKGSEIKAAKEEIKIAQDNQDELARTIRVDVLTKYKQYKTFSTLVVLQNQVVDDIHAAFLQTEKRFNEGTATIEAYSVASRTYNEELTKQLNLQLQQDIARLEVEKMIGVRLATVIN